MRARALYVSVCVFVLVCCVTPASAQRVHTPAHIAFIGSLSNEAPSRADGVPLTIPAEIAADTVERRALGSAYQVSPGWRGGVGGGFFGKMGHCVPKIDLRSGHCVLKISPRGPKFVFLSGF